MPLPNRIPPRRRWSPAQQPTGTRTRTDQQRTQRRVDQRDRVAVAYDRINTALSEARAKGQTRTVKHLLRSLDAVDKALDILGEQTTNRSK